MWNAFRRKKRDAVETFRTAIILSSASLAFDHATEGHRRQRQYRGKRLYNRRFYQRDRHMHHAGDDFAVRPRHPKVSRRAAKLFIVGKRLEIPQFDRPILARGCELQLVETERHTGH